MNTLVMRWMHAKQQLNILKAQELALRNEIMRSIDLPLDGSKTVFYEGQKLRATTRLNYTLDVDEFNALASSLPQEELDCVIQRPLLNAKAFNQLGDDATLKTLVTVKPGQRNLTIV